MQMPRRHPPPLAQRERSTSAPNVCFNMVSNTGGIDPTLEDWSYRCKAHLAGTGTYIFKLMFRARLILLFFCLATALAKNYYNLTVH